MTHIQGINMRTTWFTFMGLCRVHVVRIHSSLGTMLFTVMGLYRVLVVHIHSSLGTMLFTVMGIYRVLVVHIQFFRDHVVHSHGSI